MNVVMTGSEFLTVFAAASTAPFHAEEGALAGSTKQPSAAIVALRIHL